MALTSQRGTLICAVALAATAGCSFKLAKPPPPPSTWPPAPARPWDAERCQTSMVPPISDTLAFAGLNTVAILERHAASEITPLAFALVSIPVAVSAIYGYISASECRRYQRRFDPPQH
jgi:hypothetical protein